MMTYYTEKNGTTLLSGASAATEVSRINGLTPPSWPVVLEFGNYSLEISQNGELALIHNGPLSENPIVGESALAGTFSFHLTDGITETAQKTARVSLNGVAVAPMSLTVRSRNVTEGSEAGAVLGTLEAKATAPVTYTLEASSLPAEIVGNEVRATAPVPAGAQTITVRADNAQGSLSEVLSLPQASLVYRGQHDATLAGYAGPSGGEATFTSQRGTTLNPESTGIYRYVDGSVGVSGNGLSGATAYKTIQEAIVAHQEGDTILIAPGVYGEYLTIANGSNKATKAGPVKLCRQGSGRVDITATDSLTGWTPCVSGDADNNPNWANMWKTTFTPKNGSIAMYHRALQHSGDMAFLRVSGNGYAATEDMFSQNDKNKWWDSSNSEMSGSLDDVADILTLTSASVFGAYVTGVLDDAIVVAQYTPGNNTVQCPVLSHTPSLNQLTCSFTGTGYGNGVILLNVAADIDDAGQWAFKDNGDGSYEIFYWPLHPTAMNEIRITERTKCFDPGEAAYWTFYGLDFTGAGGGSQFESTPVRSHENLFLDKPGIVFEECRMAQYVGPWGIGLDMSRCPDIKVWNCTFEYGQGGKGLSVINSPGGWTDQCLITNVSNTGVNLSGAFEQVFSYSEIRDVRSTHGNGMSVYQGADKIVVWGNKIRTGGGIGMTNQNSANLWIGMNLVIAPEGDDAGHRGIENNSTYPPARYGETTPFTGVITYLNNSVPPWETATGNESMNGIITGKTTNATHHACNNVSMGGIDPSLFGTRDTEAGTYWPTDGGTYYAIIGTYEQNIVIRPGSPPGGTFFTELGTTNIRVATPNEVFTDYASGIYTPKADGPMDTVGYDASALLPTGAWIDWFDFNRDLEGRSFDWATNAPMGALLT